MQQSILLKYSTIQKTVVSFREGYFWQKEKEKEERWQKKMISLSYNLKFKNDI